VLKLCSDFNPYADRSSIFLNGTRTISLIDAFLRNDKPPEVKPGDCYRRAHESGLRETATVLDLCKDPLGIPHVRFRVRFERPACEESETTLRMLALGAFCRAYRERQA
jgi:hypothetical protein